MQPTWKPYAALVALCFLWGTTYLAIKLGMEQAFPPFLFSGIRFVLSGAMVMAWFRLKGHSFRMSRRDFRYLMVSGLWIFPGGNLFLVLAEQEVSSGVAALFNAAFPLWVVVITRLWNPSEKTGWMMFLGILIGFLGQWMIFNEHLFGNGVLSTGLIFLVLGVINGSIGSVHMKKYPVEMNPVLAGGIQMLCCGGLTALVGCYKGEWQQLPLDVAAWYPLLYLMVAGSVLGYSFFVYALRYLPAQQVSVYAYVNPLVAVFLGWLFLDEQPSMHSGMAMLVTLFGVYLVNRGVWRQQQGKNGG